MTNELTLSDIFEIVKYSVDYEEFMINYNDLIPEIVKAKSKAQRKDIIFFMQGKNKVRKKLYDKYLLDYPDWLERNKRINKYIYNYFRKNLKITEYGKVPDLTTPF